MFIFYERVVLSKLIAQGMTGTFDNLSRGARVQIEVGDQNEMLDQPLGVLMKLYAHHCSSIVKKRAVTAKGSAVAYLIIGIGISGYFLGF